MLHNDTQTVAGKVPDGPCLIHERGSARLGVYALVDSHRFTIGRAQTNNIVIEDPKASRQHCELFFADGHWVIRDLESKNGISVNGRKAPGDTVLQFGDQIEIGESLLRLCAEFPDNAPQTGPIDGTSYVIIDRKGGTQFDTPAEIIPTKSTVSTTKPFVDLIQLGRAFSEATDSRELATSVVQGLRSKTDADLIAVLVFPTESAVRSSDGLELVGCYPPGEQAAFSDYLTQIVLSDGDGLLAHDLQDHTQLAQRDSVQNLQASSAICAPIRHENEILGVIHLYSRNLHEPLQTIHLEFVLAVADQVGALLPTLRKHEQTVKQLDRDRTVLREQLGEQIETELVGESQAIRKVKRSIARVAPTAATVLIRGESGVGKELVARAVHINSPRKDGPFVCVNCAALTESLLESELFGHEKGAFTGANERKEGRFEQAHGGTLFLDEIGEMSPAIQAKFLRVLEGQPFERVGGSASITTDVRFVTATNRDLEQAITTGDFRQDLFYRLQVIEIVVPPLRERPEDILPIARYFLEKFARRSGVLISGFTAAAAAALEEHSWPGNIRELKNVIERAVILTDHRTLTREDLQISHLSVPISAPEEEAPSESDSFSAQDTVMEPDALWKTYIDQGLTLDDIDRMYLSAVLEKFHWNKSKASRLLGIERTTLDRRLKKYGMQRPD